MRRPVKDPLPSALGTKRIGPLAIHSSRDPEGREGSLPFNLLSLLRDETAIAIVKTTTQATGTANASGAIGLKFLTLHATPDPSGIAATSHNQFIQRGGTFRSSRFPIAEA